MKKKYLKFETIWSLEKSLRQTETLNFKKRKLKEIEK